MDFQQRRIVDSAHRLTDIYRIEAGIHHLFVSHLGHHHRIVPDVHLIGQGADHGLVLYRDGGLPLIGLTGGNKDNPVRAAGTVDCRCRGILQYFYGGYVGGIDLGEGAGVSHRETVHHHKRCIGTVDGGITPDSDSCGGTGVLRGVDHLQTRGTALKQAVHRGGVDVGDGVHLDRCHRTGEVALLHGTVADYDDIVQNLCRRLHIHGYLASVSRHCCLDKLISEEFKIQCGSGRCREYEAAIEVCDSAVHCPRHGNADSYHRRAVHVVNRARSLHILGV